MEGNREVAREIPCYNLDMIISLGYRIRSIMATRFRQWATERLAEYIVKGFTMDDELLVGAGTVSHEEAMAKALTEYKKFQVKTLSPVEQAYLESIKMIEEKTKRKNKEE